MFLKSVAVFVVGLLTAAVIYPLLHEGGHAVAAALVGAEIAEFHLFPLPFVVCDISGVRAVGQLFIGGGGVLLPYLLSAALRPKNFWVWYVTVLVRGISLYAVLLSFIAVVCHMNGNSWTNEDVVHVLVAFPNSAGGLLVSLGSMGAWMCTRLVKERIFTRCMSYFDAS